MYRISTKRDQFTKLNVKTGSLCKTVKYIMCNLSFLTFWNNFKDQTKNLDKGKFVTYFSVKNIYCFDKEKYLEINDFKKTSLSVN